MDPYEVLQFVKVTLDGGPSGYMTTVTAAIIVRELERHGWAIVRKTETEYRIHAYPVFTQRT